MSAAARRESLMGWLRGRHVGTAAEAAAHFQVTARTILRDIEALRAQGEPISSSSGPGGGFHLEGRARLRPARLSSEEVVGLTIAVSIARQMATGLPYALAADLAIDRLIQTLPEARATQFRCFIQRVILGTPCSPQLSAGMGEVEAGLLEVVEEAFSMGRTLAFEYTDSKAKVTARTIEPYALLIRAPIWYIVAYDRLREAARMFRVDRIHNMVLGKESVESRPADWFAEYIECCPLGARSP